MKKEEQIKIITSSLEILLEPHQALAKYLVVHLFVYPLKIVAIGVDQSDQQT